MKKVLKYTAFIVITIMLLIVIGISYTMLALPNVGPPENIKIAITPQRLKRGQYLANNIASCILCHSPTRDWNQFGAPVTGAAGAGGVKIDENHKFPGRIYIPNITPYNLKDWTDGELFRGITTGVKKDGSPMFPIMPYESFGEMSREDVYSIIAYIRTLKPQKTNFPKPKFDFPLNVLVHTMPHKASLAATIPDQHDTVKYGAYLFKMADCRHCHTQLKNGKPITALDLAGGGDFPLPDGGIVRPANITPDKETGIGTWTKDQFVTHFTQYADSSRKPVTVKSGGFQTVMPWYTYGKMKVTDLEAIYAYLKTVKPLKYQSVRFEKPSKNSIIN